MSSAGAEATHPQEHTVHGRPPSVWAPLRNSLYRNLFIAQLASNIGTWMQSVAAQWFLVERHSSDVIVAVVQTASLGPTLVFGLFAGALADLFDRRRLLMFLQSYAVVVGLTIAVLAYLHRLGPTSLLLLTMAIGCATALTAPAWQAIQPEVVPRDQIRSASVLGSVSLNAARAIGPAIGGCIVALAGPAAVFALNAVSYAGIIVALRVWHRPRQLAPLEREQFGQAVVSGLRYVANSPIFIRILMRTALFLFPAAALPALLPVAAAHHWHRGSAGYGVALAVIGVGAVLAVTIAGPLHRRMSDNVLLAASAATCGVAPLAVTWLRFVGALPFLALSGMAWLTTLTILNASAQLSLPTWVRARGLAIYLVVATGAQAFGAYAWGVVSTLHGLRTAWLGSAAILGLVALSVVVYPLLENTGTLSLDLSTAWPTPVVMFEPSPQDGPVLVSVRYHVPEDNRPEFTDAMSAVRRSRLRTGGYSWRLYQAVEQPDIFLERFTVVSWSEFEQLRTQRWVESDHDGVAKAVSYTVDGARRHEYYLAKRTPR